MTYLHDTWTMCSNWRPEWHEGGHLRSKVTKGHLEVNTQNLSVELTWGHPRSFCHSPRPYPWPQLWTKLGPCVATGPPSLIRGVIWGQRSPKVIWRSMLKLTMELTWGHFEVTAISPQPYLDQTWTIGSYWARKCHGGGSFEVEGHLEVSAQNWPGKLTWGHFEVTAISSQPLFSILAILKMNYGCEMSLMKSYVCWNI